MIVLLKHKYKSHLIDVMEGIGAFAEATEGDDMVLISVDVRAETMEITEVTPHSSNTRVLSIRGIEDDLFALVLD